MAQKSRLESRVTDEGESGNWLAVALLKSCSNCSSWDLAEGDEYDSLVKAIDDSEKNFEG